MRCGRNRRIPEMMFGRARHHSSGRLRDLQKSSAQEANLILTVLLPGAPLRTAQALSEGSSTPACNALRKPRERLAPSHPLPRFLRRCAGRDTARFWPRSRRGPARGRTRRTGGSARTAPSEPSFRSASIPAMCQPGEPRRMECRRFQPCISECRRIPANPAPKSPGSSLAFPQWHSLNEFLPFT